MPAKRNGTTPVRDVAKRIKRGRKAYIVPTEKNAHGFVAGESFLERNHLLCFSLLTGLEQLWDQPVCIDLENQNLVASRSDLPKKDGSRVASYTADAKYQLEGGQIGVCESKPSAFVEKHADRHAQAKKVLEKFGMTFLTLTESRFTPVFISNLENLKKALSPAQKQNSKIAAQKIEFALQRQNCWRTLDLKRVAGLSNADIFFGLAYGLLSADMNELIFSETGHVRAAHGSLDHLKFMEL